MSVGRNLVEPAGTTARTSTPSEPKTKTRPAAGSATYRLPFLSATDLRGLTSGALLGGLLLVLFWKKGTALPVVIGAVTSLAAMIFISQIEWTQTTPAGETAKVKLAWPWFTLTGTLITLGVAWTVRLLTGGSSSATSDEAVEATGVKR